MHTKKRCSWAGNDPDYIAYHDHEWGVPVHDERRHFEMLVLEGFQAGLSWLTILKKRSAFTEAFAGWDWKKVASYDHRDIARLMNNRDIVRNRRKIEAAAANAACFETVRQEFGSFDAYIWRFTDNTTHYVTPPYARWEDVPAETAISRTMSKDLRSRGFRFVGPVICYAHMQAIGMQDDHLSYCFKCTTRNPS